MIECPRCGFREALSVAEAAELLGVSGQTIRNWIRSGKLTGAVTTTVPGTGYRWWIPKDVLESDEVKELVVTAQAAAASSRKGKVPA